MLSFNDWSDDEEEEVNGHQLTSISVSGESSEIAKEILAAVVPEHYAAPDRLADILRKLGKPAVAKYVETLLPNTPSLRSGDLGEILATEYIDENTEFVVPIKRLRWKDHREMAMRGDDAIGVRIPGKKRPIDFLKVEAKSRAALRTSVVREARSALDASSGLPTSHALNYVAERAHETGKEDIADAIHRALLLDGINPQQVEHMLFAFSGNNPNGFLKADLEGYGGAIPQNSVGLRIDTHQAFIKSVFEEVAEEHES